MDGMLTEEMRATLTATWEKTAPLRERLEWLRQQVILPAIVANPRQHEIYVREMLDVAALLEKEGNAAGAKIEEIVAEANEMLEMPCSDISH
jgi:hypothetical protein